MSNKIIIKTKIKNFNKKIYVSGDKSLSIRWVLFASLAKGISKAKNLLISQDVIAAINIIKKLGIKVQFSKKICKIYGKGIDGYKYKKNLNLNAQNSGTLGRLILGLLINTPFPIKLLGDQSLSNRDFKRVTDPLSEFGAKFKLHKNKNLPLTIYGSNNLKPIIYRENKGSAQCKSSVILGSMRANGISTIIAKKSRNHTELLAKYLKLPIKINTFKNYDLIKVNRVKKIKKINYEIPSDISSSAFFIVLTALNKNSKLTIKNVNINSSRTGIITILKKMGVNIIFENKKIYKGEKIADIKVNGAKSLKAINCPSKLNSGAIDEFLVIFLAAAKAKGISYFKNLGELNQKESPRLKWGKYILTQLGIKTAVTKDSIKIFGNPKLNINKKIIIKNYLKDHRVFMTSVIAALSFGGEWSIYDKSSINTSFPNFLKIINELKK
ncbi:3-phosphoshikimate 1-carboxyvinyltransferase [Candidatus Pelagibacter sp.]|uniref:3-phosphoshikimate 1-carboxyvinyltransferase n=1 Tax=Candidatus Pelagibacter sp. TaxID=2024849 RepID=UPI003F852EE2|tara:strand:- start:597 stop:1916 length:1320 start_codon:yes stop_codon:yes gene_type:complete